MKKLFFIITLLTFNFAFAEKKWAIWIQDGGDIMLYKADSITFENGFVKLEGNIKRYPKIFLTFDIKTALQKSKEYGINATKPIGEGTLYINSNKVFGVQDFEE